MARPSTRPNRHLPRELCRTLSFLTFACGANASQEPLPEPTTAEIAREAEQEAAIFAQAANIDKLLNMLRTFDPAKDNLADNEEIQVCI